MSVESAAAEGDTRQRRVVRVLIWAGALCAIAIAFRYLVIELRPVAEFCEDSGAPWWCAIREAIIRIFWSDLVGMMSLGMGIVALLLGGRQAGSVWAIAAIIWAAPSIVLYSADYAAPAFLLGLIRLIRG